MGVGLSAVSAVSAGVEVGLSDPRISPAIEQDSVIRPAITSNDTNKLGRVLTIVKNAHP